MWYTTSRYFEHWDMLQRTIFHLSNTKNPPSLEPRKNPSTFHYIIGRILLLVYFNLHIIGSFFIPKQSPKQPGARAFAHKHGPFSGAAALFQSSLALGVQQILGDESWHNPWGNMPFPRVPRCSRCSLVMFAIRRGLDIRAIRMPIEQSIEWNVIRVFRTLLNSWFFSVTRWMIQR